MLPGSSQQLYLVSCAEFTRSLQVPSRVPTPLPGQKGVPMSLLPQPGIFLTTLFKLLGTVKLKGKCLLCPASLGMRSKRVSQGTCLSKRACNYGQAAPWACCPSGWKAKVHLFYPWASQNATQIFRKPSLGREQAPENRRGHPRSGRS